MFALRNLTSELDGLADGILRREFGMTNSQFQFMATLQDLEGADVTTLARALSVSKAAVSKRVPWFVHRGLVTISRQAVGARRLELAVTPKGLKLADEAARALDAEFVDSSALFQGIDISRLHSDLNFLLDRVRALKNESPGR